MSTFLHPILQAASAVETMPTSEASPLGLLIGLVLVVFMIAALWKVYTKAGEAGWAAIVPIYNIIVLLRISGKPWWWLLLMLIPVVGIVIAILVSISLAKSFGKGVGFGIGLFLFGFIFIPVLAFSDAKYQGPQG